MITCDVGAHVGAVREHNEDAVVIGSTVVQARDAAMSWRGPGPAIVAVSDGMGGHAAGARASRCCADALARWRPGGDVVKLVEQANRVVHDRSMAEPRMAGMGATVVALVIDEDTTTFVSAGDSPAWRVDGRYLVDQVPRDRGPTGGLTKSVGGLAELVPVQPHVTEVELRGATRFVLSSDGLSDVVPVDTIEELVIGGPIDGLAHRLVFTALGFGAPDNVTMVVVDVHPEGEDE